MYKGSRINKFFKLFKIANNSLESKFVEYMLSNSFPDFVKEEDEEEESLTTDNMKLLFQKILDEVDVTSLKHIGAIIFWILNERITPEEQSDYAANLLTKLVKDDYYGEKFSQALRHLSSGRHGGNSQAVLDSIISHGVFRDMLDKKTHGGLTHDNYRIYNSRELWPYIVNKYTLSLETVIDNVIASDSVGWEESSSLIRAVNALDTLGTNLKDSVFNGVKNKFSAIIDKFEDASYMYQRGEMIESILDAFDSLLDEDILLRLNNIYAKSERVSPSGPRGMWQYVQEVKKAIGRNDLSELYSSPLDISTNLPENLQRNIVHSVLSNVSEIDDVEFLKEKIIAIFFKEKLNQKYPDLLNHIIELMIAKMPSYFLGINTWWNKPEGLSDIFNPDTSSVFDESDIEEYKVKALKSLFVVSTNDFINLMNTAEGNEEGVEINFGGEGRNRVSQEVLRSIFNEKVSEKESLNEINTSNLISLFKNLQDTKLDEATSLQVTTNLFNIILEKLDSSTCEEFTDSFYKIEPEELKTDLIKRLGEKIENNINEFYKCYISNSYKINRYLDSNAPSRLEGKSLQAVIEAKDSVTYFDHFYTNYTRGYRYALIPEPFRHSLKRLEKVDDRVEAKEIHEKSTNDIDVESFPDSKIKYSGYQDQQRAAELTDNNISRYDLTQDNTDPTPIMYDINKNHVSAADFMMHTNLGSSGFTSAWALISFPEDKLLIEQIQSDYPVMLDRTFNRMPPSKKTYRNLSYKSSTGSRFELSYRDGGGVYIMLKAMATDGQGEDLGLGFDVTQLQEGVSELGTHLLRPADEVELEIMSPEVFLDYANKAKKFEEISSNYSSTEEEQQNAYEEASNIYRNRSKEIRSRLDNLGLIPSALHGLQGKYPETEIMDAKKHIDVISQNYPYLIIINAMKTAQRMEQDFIYLLKSGGSSIQNKKKRKKIYSDLPNSLSATNDKILEMSVFKIPATNENIAKVKAMMPIKKPHGYSYSLLPSQNKAIMQKRHKEERREKRTEQEKRDIKLSRDQIMPVKVLFDKAEIPIPDGINEVDTVGDLLKFLNIHKNLLKSKGITKKDINKAHGEIARLRLAEIIESFGLRKFGMEKAIPLYGLLINCNLNKEAEELFNMIENISNNENLLLRGDSL